jgi:hypothetical protein
MGSIPALNYTIRHSLNRLAKQHLYYEEELLTTRKLLFGYPGIAAVSQNGVVSPTDPAGNTAGSSSPLVVSVNSQNQLTVDVNPGMGVFLSGVWLELHTIQRQIALADTTTGVPNVVYLKYLLEDAPLSVNDALQTVIPYTLRIGDPIETTTSSESLLLGVDTVANYLSYPATALADYIPLAIVTTAYDNVLLSSYLAIDHTRASYSWNRPWFSPVDAYHRGQVGTGTVTAENPHGTSGNDLTYGNFTALQTCLDYGMVISDDKSVPKVPGYRCEVQTSTFLHDDVSGSVTGYPSAAYAELPNYPVALGRCWEHVTGDPYPALHVPGTNKVVFPYSDPSIGALTIHMYYSRVEAVEPPLPNATTFATNGPTADELVVAGGIAHTALTNVEETMGDAYQFPCRYDFFVDGTGTLLKTPQVVYCWKMLTAIGVSDTATITPYGPGRLQMGLMGAGPDPLLDVKITVAGTDATGANITYQFIFSGATWAEIGPLPNANVTPLDPRAFVTSTNVFATVSTITIDASNADANAGIMIWMLQTPYSNYTKMKDCCHVASAVWDGYRLAKVYDKRVISTTSKPEQTLIDAPQNELLIRVLAGGSITVYSEDFRRPKYNSLQDPDDMSMLMIRGANYPTLHLSKWQPGIHGGYYSAAFPVVPGSGDTWRLTLFGVDHRDTTFLKLPPIFYYYFGGVWGGIGMAAVPGLPGTYTATTPAGNTPTSVLVHLLNVISTGYVIYG